MKISDEMVPASAEVADPTGAAFAQVLTDLSRLDGTRRARVALRTGIPLERLDDLGSVGEDPS